MNYADEPALVDLWEYRLVKLRIFDDFPKEWVLVITTTEQLLKYLKLVRPTMREAMRLAEKKIAGHYTDNLAYAVSIRAGCRGESFVEGLTGLCDDIDCGMFSILENGHILYIKSVGSYSHDTQASELYEIIETRMTDKLMWPKVGTGVVYDH